jgi:hypothetical protein
MAASQALLILRNTSEIIERSKQGDRPVTIVVMGGSLDVAGFKW